VRDSVLTVRQLFCGDGDGRVCVVFVQSRSSCSPSRELRYAWQFTGSDPWTASSACCHTNIEWGQLRLELTRWLDGIRRITAVRCDGLGLVDVIAVQGTIRIWTDYPSVKHRSLRYRRYRG
jgi:hypothetical protein